MGPRRFQRPVRQYLAGELNATKQCLPCPQRDPYDKRRIIGHEDCLCLNVYAPKMPGSEDGNSEYNNYKKSSHYQLALISRDIKLLTVIDVLSIAHNSHLL